MTNKQIITELIEIYATAVKDTKIMRGQEYQFYLLRNKLLLGFCHVIECKLEILTVRDIMELYWIKRNISGQHSFIYPSGHNGHQYLVLRLALLERELKLINQYGWFARFIPNGIPKFKWDNK